MERMFLPVIDRVRGCLAGVGDSLLSAYRDRPVWTSIAAIGMYLCAIASGAIIEAPAMNQSGVDSHGQVLVVQESLNRVVLLPKARPEDRTIINVGEKPHEVELSTDNRSAYVSNFGLLEANHKIGTPGNTISVIDVVQKRERTRFKLPDGRRAPHGLKIRPQHPGELFTNTEEGTEDMVVLNADSGAIVRSFPLPLGIHNFIFSADGSDCYAFAPSGNVFRLDPTTGHILAQAAIPNVRGLAWTSNHSHLLVGAREQVLLLTPQELTVARTIADLSVGQTFYPAASSEGSIFLVPAVLDGVLLIVDANTGQVRKRIATGSPLQAIFDGRYAWVSNVKVPASMLAPGKPERSGALIRLDLSNFQFQRIADTEDANGIAIIP